LQELVVNVRGRAGDLFAIGVLVGVVAVLGARLIRHNPMFTRIDELDHFNCVTSPVDRHRIPVAGDLYTSEAIPAEACWGNQLHPPLPPCSAPVLDPHAFGADGRSSAAGYRARR
jgi:hypothetical protein